MFISWHAPNDWTGIVGHRIHVGLVESIYTLPPVDVLAPGTSGNVTVPFPGLWHVAVAAYDKDGYEGAYSLDIVVNATEGQMAGVSIFYDKGKFSWTYAAGNPPGTALELRYGTAPGVYTGVKSYPAATGEAMVSAVLPAGSQGQFYARLFELIGTEAGVSSPEVPFVVSVRVPAVLTFGVA